MPELFFQPNQRSHCLFKPRLWCEPYDEVDGFSFFCAINPFDVVVVVPPTTDEQGARWDAVYERVEHAWRESGAGFSCSRVGSQSWGFDQPCRDCEAVRLARVVVVDLNSRDRRSDDYLNMAAISLSNLNVLQQIAADSEMKRLVPQKKLVLINCGSFHEREMAVFDCIDYSHSDGTPDLDRLEQQMRRIADSELVVQTLDLSDLATGGEPQIEPLVITVDNVKNTEMRVNNDETALEDWAGDLYDDLFDDAGEELSEVQIVLHDEEHVEPLHPVTDLVRDSSEVQSEGSIVGNLVREFEARLKKEPMALMKQGDYDKALRQLYWERLDERSHDERKRLIDECLKQIKDEAYVELFFTVSEGRPFGVVRSSPVE